MGKTYTKHICCCKFNQGVDCEMDPELDDCSKCGWNPEIEQQRLDDISNKYDFKKAGERLDKIYVKFRMGRITRKEAHEEFDKIKFALLGSLKSVPIVK